MERQEDGGLAILLPSGRSRYPGSWAFGGGIPIRLDPGLVFAQPLAVAVVKAETGAFIMAIERGTAATDIFVFLHAAFLTQHIPAEKIVGASPLGPPVVAVMEQEFARGFLDGSEFMAGVVLALGWAAIRTMQRLGQYRSWAWGELLINYAGGPVRCRDLWAMATAQIFSEVSPSMHEEFALG